METFGQILVVLLASLALVAFFSVLSALFPARIARTRLLAETMAPRSFLIGAVNGVLVAAIAAALFALAEQSAQLLALPGLLLLILLGIGLVFGLSATAQIVGARIFPEHEARRQVAQGSAVLILACLTPFVGWFGLLVYAGLLGLGAFISSFFARPPEAVTQAEA
jgi:predicted permease